MRKIIFCQGLMASGKSTWAKDFVKKNQNWKRISRDDFRHMTSSYTYNSKNEKLVQKLMVASITTLIKETNYNIVFDEMNLDEKRLNETKAWIKTLDANVEFETKVFNITLKEAIARDLKRENSLGPAVVRRTYHKFFTKQNRAWDNKKLKTCIISDIDGTIASKGNRSAFDWHKVGEDLPILQTIDMLASFHSVCTIILFSGRDSVCRPETLKWLEDNLVKYDELYMRGEGDNRKDTIVKSELFKNHVEGQYYPYMVIDDRAQVLEMWQEEYGLFTINVNQDVYVNNDF